MKKTLFLYSGEGTQGNETRFRLIKQSTRWMQIEDHLRSSLNLDLEQIWKNEINRHRCPHSPLLTVISQICLSDTGASGDIARMS